MDRISAFTTKKIDDTSSMLIFDSREISVINGEVIEAQFKTENGQYLLIASDNCPYEEGINIYLLSSDKDVLDHVTIAQNYTSGQFEGLEIMDDSTIKFSFIREEKFKLNIFPNGKFKLIPEFRGYIQQRYNPFGKKYLEIN